MSDIAQKILTHANLTRMSSLPELLLCELNVLQDSATSPPFNESDTVSLENLLAGDMFLYARVLSSTSLDDSCRFYSPAQLIQRLGHNGLKAMVKQAAAQMSFGQASPSQVRFLKQLYLQSLLSSALAQQLAITVLPESEDKAHQVQQAGFCGLFLNIGALVLEQVHSGDYLEMLARASDTATLLSAEKQAFNIDHAELGAHLLKSWGVSGLCCDALQYHHLDISQILDATPLVKIAWLANQLADEAAHLEAPVWADALFDLKEISLMEIRNSAQEKVDKTSRILKVAYSTTRYLPLPASDEEDVLKQEKKALKQLRRKAEADNLMALAKEGLVSADSREQLSQALGSATRLLFGQSQSLLFIHSEDDGTLSCLAGTAAEKDCSQIVIRCEPERSVIADCFLNRCSILQNPGQEQTVIDRQVLSMLDSNNISSEPLFNPQTGEPCGVLVLGLPLEQTDKYKKQQYLRRDLCQELGKLVSGKQSGHTDTAADGVVAGYERRIKETIHEANNPLGIIKNYLQLLSMKQGEDTRIQSEISFMKSEIDRVSSILEKLKEKPEETQPVAGVDINQVVTSLVSMFRGSFTSDDNITIETRLDPDLPELFLNENAMRQIITNLVKNSAEAFEDGGTLSVKTAGNFYMNGNRYIQLIVRDNGPGIAANILKTLFTSGNSETSDAEFNANHRTNQNINISTKGGSHTGSGLSIVKNLVNELGGQISCQTSPADSAVKTGELSDHDNSGTEITVLLPVVSEPPTPLPDSLITNKKSGM